MDLPPPGVCSVEGCTRTGEIVRGFCKPHYTRWLRHGDPGADEPIFTRVSYPERCLVEGCGRTEKGGFGLCHAHYQRYKKQGEPGAARPTEIECAQCGQVRRVGKVGIIPTRCKACNKKNTRKASPEESFAHQLKYRHNITLEQLDQLLVDQEYQCRICPSEVDRYSGVIDHNHSCCPARTSGPMSCGNCIRGVLCLTCNWGLGQFKENSDLLFRAYQYLTDYVPVLRAIEGVHRNCEWCGEPFEVFHPATRFCCRAHKETSWRTKQKEMKSNL